MTTSRPLVSLVIPTYNQAQYLTSAVESVLAQTYPHLELIVLDDGSTDDTTAVLRRLEPRVRHQRHDNMGQANTLNLGWGMSRGEILGYLSSDDLLRPDAVARSVAALETNPNAVACYCDFDLIDEQGRTVRRVVTEAYSPKRLVEDLVCFPGPGALFRRSVFDDCGGWRGSFRQIPDFDFWLRAHRLGPFVRIPFPLAAYRIHDSSASYRQAPESRSEEIVIAVDDYWRTYPGATEEGLSRTASVSMSFLLAARSHFSAGRTRRALMHVIAAWRLAPQRSCSVLAWRILIGGLVRRPYYAFRQRFCSRGRSMRQ